ncbi:sulfurtransferase [bacterium SCSIO 12696]|nr:sulfurtransferase [bacterium SCSIO 12696]
MTCSPLISVQELHQQLGKDMVIFDCRFSLANTEQNQQAYDISHIPGSHYLHLDRDLSGPLGTHGGRHPMPTRRHFEALMQRYGVNSNTLVVVYDDQRFAFASRLWWMLRYFGHQNVKVLDGGFSAWYQAELETTSQIPTVAKSGQFEAKEQTQWLLSYKDIAGNLDNTSRLLIDSREAPRYQGLEEPIDPITGHIPGAANFPWQEVTDDSGFARCPSHQKQRWSTLPGDKEWVVYCGSGVTACVNLLAMEIAGLPPAKLYGGSWSDWCSYQ